MTEPVSIPFCGAAPTPADLVARWTLDPALLAVLGLLPILYHVLRSRAGSRQGRYEVACFWAGWTALVLAFVSPLCALSVALFSARVGHHVILVAVAAPLLALGNPWRGRGRALPIGVALAAHAATLWFWHAPMPYAEALSSDLLYWVMQASLLGSAIVFWSALLDPRVAPLSATAYALGAMMQMGFLGALITFTPRPLYAAHFLSAEPFGLSALADQQLAGLVMWAPGALPYLLAALVFGMRLVSPLQGDRAR